MLKRIQLSQLRVGMFVRDMEFATQSDAERFRPFLLSKGEDLRRLTTGHVRSVVIDITKRVDVAGGAHPIDITSFEANVLAAFSPGEIGHAKRSIQDIGPHLRHVLHDAGPARQPLPRFSAPSKPKLPRL